MAAFVAVFLWTNKSICLKVGSLFMYNCKLLKSNKSIGLVCVPSCVLILDSMAMLATKVTSCSWIYIEELEEGWSRRQDSRDTNIHE